MYETEGGEMIICPYNSHHVVSKLRIQKHIIKCQKNNPDIKLATCFYNYSHRLKPEDLLAHYEICSHKTRLDGARYDEPDDTRSSFTYTRTEFPRRNFPNINVRTQFFCNSPFHFSGQTAKEDEENLETSTSEHGDENFQLKAVTKTAFKTKFSHEDKEYDINDSDDVYFYDDDYDDDNIDFNDISDDDDLEPLPLPKTVSKAFVYSKEQESESLAKTILEPSQTKQFGRGKRLLEFLPPKHSRTTDHLLPDLSDMENDLPKKEKNSRFFLKNLTSNYSASLVSSSMLDDSSTLKSEDVTFDGVSDKSDDDGFIFKNFDKYTKI